MAGPPKWLTDLTATATAAIQVAEIKAEDDDFEWTPLEHTDTDQSGSSWTTTYQGASSGVIATPGEPIWPAPGVIFADAKTSWHEGGDIIDRIDDALTTPLYCPHCRRDWHPGPLTNRVANMLGAHKFDPDYDPAADDSRIVCVGADFQGPRPARWNTYQAPVFDGGDVSVIMSKAGDSFTALSHVIDNMVDPLAKAQSAMAKMYAALQELAWPQPFTIKLWHYEPEPECVDAPVDLTDAFGPPWWATKQLDAAPYELAPAAKLVQGTQWEADSFPVPESPGYDFTHLATVETDYSTIGKGKK